MAFLPVLFPPKISIGAVGGPRFMTSLAIMASGAESRNQDWELERGEWTVSHDARRPHEWPMLMKFFRNMAGRANTCLFKDWSDFECAVGEGFFVANETGSPTTLQMVKRYTYEGFTYDRFITKPVNGTIVTDAVGLDYATGLANSGTFWSGQFYCWVRLDLDAMKVRIIDRTEQGLIVGWGNIDIIEVTNESV